MQKLYESPNAEMLEARNLFSKSSERIDCIVKKLADEESKSCYLGMLAFRQSSDERDFPGYTCGMQYFRDEIFTWGQEVLLDCGAYRGETVQAALESMRNQNAGQKLVSAVALEPDKVNYRKATKKLRRLPSVTVLNVGAWSENIKLFFCDNGLMDGKLSSDAGGKMIDCMRIDDIPACSDVSFIKMDIEGAELDALKGAKQTILRNRPKLAICIYHRNEDFMRIPEYLMNLLPDYRFFIRHHCPFLIYETVLYAVPQ